MKAYPAGLSGKSKKWYKLMTEFYGFGPDELVLLTQAAQTLDRIDEARAEVAEFGGYSSDRYGNRRKSPGIQVETDSKLLFIRILKALNIEQEEQRGPGRPASF